MLIFEHCPASGVNVYVADSVLLTIEGDHVPVIPLDKVLERAGISAPKQYVAIRFKPLKRGNTSMLITISCEHCPSLGVKVYVADSVLLTVEGDHVPVMPLLEVEGKIGAVSPTQIGLMASKLGVIFGLMDKVSAVLVLLRQPDAMFLVCA